MNLLAVAIAAYTHRYMANEQVERKKTKQMYPHEKMKCISFRMSQLQQPTYLYSYNIQKSILHVIPARSYLEQSRTSLA